LIRDRYGMVDLVFKLETMGTIDMNYLVLKVKYWGPFGWCNGFIRNRTGNNVIINQFFGMGEDKYVRG